MIKARVRKRDGRRVYDVRLRDPNGRVYNRTFETKKEALAFEAAERASRNRGAWVDPRHAEVAFSDLAARWMAANPAKRASSRATDETIVRAHLVPIFGRRPIGSVTQPDVQRLVNAWIETAAPRTVRRQYGVLGAIFAYAVAADWLGRSPCRNINLPAVTTRRRRALSDTDIAAIAAATPDRYRAMVWLGAVLGLRWSEVAGLVVGSLDLLRRTVTIDQTITRDSSGRPVFGPPKSAAGLRTLSIPAALADVLAGHMAAGGLTGAAPDQLIFQAPEGGVLRYDNWRRRVWQPAAKSGGCPGAGFHDLRRANATALVTGGVDLKTAQTRLGHRDPRLTIATYAQAVAEADRRAADSLGETFLKSLVVRPRDARAMCDTRSHELSGYAERRTELMIVA
jgi:integrase